MKLKILIIDDDELVCLSLKKILIKLGYDADYCKDGEEAFENIKLENPDVLLLDIYLSSDNGIELLKEFKTRFPHLPVIMITGYADIKIAVTAIKAGAMDFLLKPIDLEQLQIVLNKLKTNLDLMREVERLHEIIEEDLLPKEFFGPSKNIQKLVQQVEKLAKSSDTTILLEGESGTGKEVFAKFIHQNSPRNKGAFIQINCSAIPKDLAESELFGHERGAFTGAAQKTKMGKFELSNGGTILLDEIGELSLELQAKLLRVLQEKKFYRLGGEKEIQVDVRVIAATNRNLEDEASYGRFREDLFYRLNVAKIVLPPLRNRKEDIAFLTYRFIKEFSKKFNKYINGVEDEALNLLNNYNWKGNIRELRNVIERAILLTEKDTLQMSDFDHLISGKSFTSASQDKFKLIIPAKGIQIDLVLKELIQKTLVITKGNQLKAAKVLGLSRSKLRYRMEQLGIEVTKSISDN